jgi:hypothetical protein
LGHLDVDDELLHGRMVPKFVDMTSTFAAGFQVDLLCVDNR